MDYPINREGMMDTSLHVTFYSKEDNSYYELELHIVSSWINVITKRIDMEIPPGAPEIERAKFTVGDFTTWNRTDPMFNPGGINGILIYCNKVLLFPEWINKFQLTI